MRYASVFVRDGLNMVFGELVEFGVVKAGQKIVALDYDCKIPATVVFLIGLIV